MPPMKEEMQGYHMTPNFEIFISEKTLFWPHYTTKRITPGTSRSHVRNASFLLPVNLPFQLQRLSKLRLPAPSFPT